MFSALVSQDIRRRWRIYLSHPLKKDCFSMSSTVLKLLASYEKAAFRSFKKKKCTLLSFVVLAQRYKTSLSTPPHSLKKSYGWYSLCMHMLSCPILDLLIKIERKWKEYCTLTILTWIFKCAFSAEWYKCCSEVSSNTAGPNQHKRGTSSPCLIQSQFIKY